MTQVVYSPKYNIGFFGLERLHPFDSKKYGRVWRSLCDEFGPARMRAITLQPQAQLADGDMRLVHNEEYLSSLRNSDVVAAALELPPLARLPAQLIDRYVLRPMRWAAAGTCLAAEACLSSGFTVNLGGGFHHAKPDGGEGFSVYADAAIAIQKLRLKSNLAEDANIVIVDTDAHQGNGLCHIFQRDRTVQIFDIYNADIYPSSDRVANSRIDCNVPLEFGTSDDRYLAILRERLPSFLDHESSHSASIAIYNAGTDVFTGDPLGGLNVSAAGVLERDLFVIEQLRIRCIPTVMLLSGGYTPASHQLVSRSLIEILRTDTSRD